MVSLVDQTLEDAGLAKRRPVRHGSPGQAGQRSPPRAVSDFQRARGVSAHVEDEVLAGLTAPERDELLTLLRRALASAPRNRSGAPPKGTNR